MTGLANAWEGVCANGPGYPWHHQHAGHFGAVPWTIPCHSGSWDRPFCKALQSPSLAFLPFGGLPYRTPTADFWPPKLDTITQHATDRGAMSCQLKLGPADNLKQKNIGPGGHCLGISIVLEHYHSPGQPLRGRVLPVGGSSAFAHTVAHGDSIAMANLFRGFGLCSPPADSSESELVLYDWHQAALQHKQLKRKFRFGPEKLDCGQNPNEGPTLGKACLPRPSAPPESATLRNSGKGIHRQASHAIVLITAKSEGCSPLLWTRTVPTGPGGSRSPGVAHQRCAACPGMHGGGGKGGTVLMRPTAQLSVKTCGGGGGSCMR